MKYFSALIDTIKYTMKLPLKMLHALYDYVLHLSSHPKAPLILYAISFAESSFFPIPPDILLIPLVLMLPQKAYRIAFFCTLSSVIGGYFGYFIGSVLYDTVAVPIIHFYDAESLFESFKQSYHEYGAWIVAGAGFTPFPYKIITITSGVCHLDLLVFSLASVLSRGARFFLVAALLKKYGEPMNAFIKKNLGWLSTLFFLLLVGGFWLAK